MFGSQNITRDIVLTLIVTLILWDVWCYYVGWPTITSQIRLLNQQTGWLVCLFWLALWFHFFFYDALELFMKIIRGQ